MCNVQTRTAEWLEVKARVEKLMDDGAIKEVRQSITIDAKSFTEAETIALDYFAQQGIQFTAIDQISRARYKEVFFYEPGVKYYRATLKFITIDEKTLKEKRQSVYYLIQASTLDEARKNINDVFSKSVIDYEIFSITESPIEEAILHYSNI